MRLTRKVALSTAVVAGSAVIYYGCKTPSTRSELRDAIADSDAYSKVKLEMSADSQTGDVFISFNARAAGLKVGDKAEIAWDVLKSNRDVNCSALRKRVAVTVTGDGETTETEFNVDPSALADSLDNSAGDGEKETKYGHQGINNFAGETVVEGCLMVPGKGFVAAGAAMPDHKATAGYNKKKRQASGAAGGGFGLADDDDSELPIGLRYGERCAKAIGYIKPFSCIGDGVTVPITVEGQQQERFVQTCDRPQYLPIGDTQCATNTRVGRLKLYADKNLTQERTDGKAVYFCRHYKDPTNYSVDGTDATRGPNYPYFHDVAVIMQNTETGKTCYFQALGGGRPQGEDGEDLYGLRVPPPTETTEEFQAKIEPQHKEAGAQTAWKNASLGGFWLSPGNIGQIHCISCHDSDPFMHSPWIDQVKLRDDTGNITTEYMVPSEPFADYKVIGAGVESFNNWDTSYSVETQDAKCMSCHRIGSMAAIRSWVKDAYPLHEPSANPANSEYYDLGSKSPWSKIHPNHHWMPPPSASPTWAANLDKYKKSSQQLRDCLDVRRADGTRILGYGRINKPSKHKLSDEDIATLGSKGCTVAPISEVVER